jgi:hypothetical protein
MKFLKYIFIALGVIYVIDIIDLIFNPRETYQFLSFDVNKAVYIIFKLFLAFLFIFLAFKKNNKEV